MKINGLKHLSLAAVLAALSFAACKKDDPLAGTFNGTQTNFGSGKAWTYINNDDDGNPVEIGLIVDEAAFNSLDETTSDIALSLAYPKEATERTPFVHQFVGWNPHGHEPLGIYDLPHYDLHYYTTSEADRLAITPWDTVKAAISPSPDHFPAAYFPAGLVPQMGVHWIDGTSPELTGAPFEETFIYGSFDGKVTFWEPMIAKAFMQANATFEKDIKQPTKYDQPGKYYPTKQGFAHDTAKKEYRFYLSGFVKR